MAEKLFKKLFILMKRTVFEERFPKQDERAFVTSYPMLSASTVTRQCMSVDMGLARVNEAMCFSFNGRTCGACYRACPLAGSAMKIGVFETPLVQPEICVGCGLCEQACLHLPQAIRVVPRGSGSGRSA